MNRKMDSQEHTDAGMSPTGTEPRRLPVVSRATPGIDPARLTWPIVLAVAQVIWTVIWALQPLDWDRPKRPVFDSLFFLLGAAPSVAAMIVSVRVARYHGRRTKRWLMVALALCCCLFSMLIAALWVYGWISDVVLDPHGRWYPL